LNPPPEGGVLSKSALVVFAALLGLTATLILLSFPVGIYTFFFTHLSTSYSPSSTATPFLWIGPLPVPLPVAVSYSALFVFVTIVYAAMFVYAARHGIGVVAAFRAAFNHGVERLFANSAIVTVVSIGFLVFSASLIDVLVLTAGAHIGDPFVGEDPLRVFLGFSLAPLREEFGFRVLIIGLAAFAVTLWRSGRLALHSLWRPSVAYEGSGADTLTLVIIWVAAAFSAGTFGACHVVCGSGGWELGKLPEATYGGVVLSYLYIKYGFHAAVLGHWGVDYFGSVFAFFGQGAYGVPWESIPQYTLQLLTTLDLTLLFGVASFVVVMYIGLRKLAARRLSTGEAAGGAGSS
jgi:hypothetical protein